MKLTTKNKTNKQNQKPIEEEKHTNRILPGEELSQELIHSLIHHHLLNFQNKPVPYINNHSLLSVTTQNLSTYVSVYWNYYKACTCMWLFKHTLFQEENTRMYTVSMISTCLELMYGIWVVGELASCSFSALFACYVSML